jgi:8-oxo-dGTP diphosphatase
MNERKYCYKYPRPALTTDAVVFRFNGAELFVLLIERGNEPFKGQWAFPGGFVNMDETTDVAAARELKEETGLTGLTLEQLHTFSEPDRDPRHRTVSVVYYALLNDNPMVTGGDDAAIARWFPVKKLPSLAFDHDDIVKMAFQRLYEKIDYNPLHFEQFSGASIASIKNILSTLNNSGS